MCLISWERTQKGDPHKLFWGIFGVQKMAPNGPFSATKSLVYCIFPALNFLRKFLLFSLCRDRFQTPRRPQAHQPLQVAFPLGKRGVLRSRKLRVQRLNTFNSLPIRDSTFKPDLRGPVSEDFSLLVVFLLVTFSWLFRGFFVAFSWPSSV